MTRIAAKSMSFFVRCTSFLTLPQLPGTTISAPSDEHPHSIMRRMLRVRSTAICMEFEMKLVARIFGGRRASNLTTELERQRLGRTMPGQTAALAASRYGFIVN